MNHGQAGTIRQLSYTAALGKGAAVRIGSAEPTAFRKHVDPDRMALLGLTAAKGLARPVWREFIYVGWDRDPLRELFEATFDRLEATPTLRFWR